MTRSLIRSLAAVPVLCITLLSAVDARAAGDDLDFFERRIRPILVDRCESCHSTARGKTQGGLAWDTRDGWERGGDSGPAIVPKHPEQSLLIRAVRYHDEELRMPPERKGGRLGESDVAALVEWVRRGAPDPRRAPSGPVETASTTVETAARSWWAFQPARAIPDPAPDPAARNASPIDRLIGRALDEAGLKPNDLTDDYEFLRRATYDLTGLPPTPREIETFLSDRGADARLRVIDRLLASPAYGERWGRHWLDLARYADTNGADENMAHPNAWRYRDYVIRAFNADTPYDRFLREQLAGDLLPRTGDVRRDQDQIVATGFLALGPKMLAEQDKDKLLIDVVDEQVDVVTKTVLGLTVSCARCHDHKFDPVSQEEYFALAGIFRSTRTLANTNHVSRWVETVLDEPGNEKIVASHRATVEAKQSEIKSAEANPPAKDAEAQLKKLKDELKKLESDGPMLPKAMAVSEGQPVNLPVHVRGNHLTPRGEPTPRGALRLFDSSLPAPRPGPKNSGRIEFVDWLTDPRHPLTARVMVNRIWKGHFGAGLVRSPSNFGVRGDVPSHPDLLDWLAGEFIRGGWSIKRMHRLIMSSQAYQRSSRSRPDNALRDPENRLLWRQNRRRLEVEPIRDALLFVSGQLERPARPSIGELERNQEYYRAEPARFDRRTRAVYLPVVRAHTYDMFATFDGADPAVHHEGRTATIVPAQALFLLNNPLATAAAGQLARSIHSNSTAPVESRIDDLYLRLFARPARPVEIELLRRELSRVCDVPAGPPRVEDWERVCRVLIAANEFVYLN